MPRYAYDVRPMLPVVFTTTATTRTGVSSPSMDPNRGVGHFGAPPDHGDQPGSLLVVWNAQSSTTTSPEFVATNTVVDDMLPKPNVTDPKLQNYVDNLYKGTTNPGRVGTGTTADAVRNEILTGQPTGGTLHSIKAQETANGLTKWLRNNPGASPSDRLVAQSLLDDLKSALGKKP